MGLLSETPTQVELPELKLVGTMAFVDFRETPDPTVFADAWTRYFTHADELADARIEPARLFGLNLFPPEFPSEMRWYYGACVEVASLDRDYPTSFLTRCLPAATYHAFEVEGPASEIAPAFDEACRILAGMQGGKLSCRVNLELYDARFHGPENPESRMDLLFPVV